MPNYRRAFVPNGCWFFTHNLLDRRQTLLVDHIDALRQAFEETQKKYPFVFIATFATAYSRSTGRARSRRVARSANEARISRRRNPPSLAAEMADYAALIRPTAWRA
jgi:hypothetical protein